MNYKYDNICVNKDSDACQLLINNKNNIIKLNNKYNDSINEFVQTIGNFERGDLGYDVLNINKQTDIITNKLTDTFYTELNKIRQENNFVTYLRRNYKYNPPNNMFSLERKTKESGALKKTNYNIVKTTFFGTGNLSISILLHFMYLKNEESNVSFSETIAKIYPLNILLSKDYENIYVESGSINQKKRDKFNLVTEFVFYKEALLGCWIQNRLIMPRVANTFVCMLDSFISKTLPLTNTDLLFLKDKELITNTKIFKKRWVKNNIERWNDSFGKINGAAEFGVIEMEKVDFTVHQMHSNRMLNLGIIFEIFYSKLCLAFIGNIFMADDHTENIMVKFTNKIRKYRIKRRNTEYVFYVDNNYIIKYIDMERYISSTNRNRFFYRIADTFLQYAKQSNYYKGYFKDSTEGNINYTMCKYIYEDRHNTIDEFCEIFYRFLPSKYTDETLYIGKQNIDEYFIDLDNERPTDFLGDIQPNTIPLDRPFKLLGIGQFGGYNRKI